LVFGQNNECKDELGHCNVVKANCRSKQAKNQMRKLCAKTCGFCKDDVVTTTLNQKRRPSNEVDNPRDNKSTYFTLEVFLMYLKNDVKFLKEEISDVKIRLRDIEKRKESTTVTTDVNELKVQTARLFTRLSDQTNQFARLMSNLSLSTFNSKNNFRAELSVLRRDIERLNKDLKEDLDKIDSLSNFNDQLKDVQENMQDMAKRSQVAINRFSTHVRNLSVTVSDRYLKLQEKFYTAINDERVKVTELGIKVDNVTRELQRERQRSQRLERVVNDLSQFKFTQINFDEDRRRIDDLTNKLANVTRILVSQNVKTSMLTALVEGLTKKPSLGTFNEMRGAINQLQSKFNYVLRRLEAQIIETRNLQRQLNNTRSIARSTPQTTASIDPEVLRRIDTLEKEVEDLVSQLEKMKRSPAQGGVNPDEFKKIFEQIKIQSSGSSGPSSSNVQSQFEFINLKQKIENEEHRVTVLENKIEEVRRNTTGAVQSIKDSIESMAAWRNNQSGTAVEIRNRYEQGIKSLLGPQQGNTTRFYNPKFDWENGRLSIYGFIAIKREGVWGTICDDAFEENEAQVLCRMAGYNGGAFENGKYKVGEGTIDGKTRSEHKIWIDELRCEGDELSVEDCRYGSEGWGIHDCDHAEDVGIKCYIS